MLSLNEQLATMEKTRMTAAEGSKLLKQTLTRAFPGTKFTCRMSRGTAYGSMDVSYTDGPSYKEVDAIADGFEGKSFDGSIDLEYHKDTSYCPVHGALFAGTNGTEGSKGYRAATGIPELGETNVLCCDKARLVDFGLGYVHVSREYTVDAKLAAIECFNHGNYNGTVEGTVKGEPPRQYVEVVDSTKGAQTPWLTPHFNEYLRNADLRDFVKLAKAAENHKAAKDEEYRVWKKNYNERMNAEALANGAKELSQAAKDAAYVRPAYGQNYLNN